MAASTLTAAVGSTEHLPSPFARELLDPVSGERSMEWLLRPNASMTGRQLSFVLLLLAVLSLGIAAGFWFTGATLILPFAGVEALMLGAAVLVHARHAGDSEHILLDRHALTVVRVSAGRDEQVQFQPAWVRVEPEQGDRSLIELSGQGRRIAVGRFVRPELRRQLAEEFRWALRRWHPGVASATA